MLIEIYDCEQGASFDSTIAKISFLLLASASCSVLVRLSLIVVSFQGPAMAFPVLSRCASRLKAATDDMNNSRL